MFKVGINSAPRIVPTEITEAQEASSQVTEQQVVSAESKFVQKGNSSIRSEAMFSATAMRAQLTQQLALNESPKSNPETLQNMEQSDRIALTSEQVNREINTPLEYDSSNRFNKASLENANVPSLNTLYTGSGDDSVFIQYYQNADIVHVSVNGKEAWRGTPEQFSNLKIDTGDGNDIVSVYTPGANIVTGRGNDQVFVGVLGSQVDTETKQRFQLLKINTGDGNDAVENHASSATILTGDGTDSVHNFGNNTAIDTGEGQDRVLNEGNMNRIETGSGDDQVHNYGSDNEISTASGDDQVYNYGSDNEIRTGSGDDTVSSHGAILVQDPAEAIWNYADGGRGDRNTIDTGDGNDFVSFGLYADDNRVSTGSGDDFVVNNGSNNQVDTAEDKDS